MEDVSDHVFFFDVDNTLYPQSTGIGDMMADRIKKYCVLRMGMTEEDAARTSKKYYLDYGLAIRGLLKHHNICPLDYDEFVDGGLPLDSIITPNEELRQMLLKLKTRRWVFTNAGIYHANRVLRLLGISDLFEGITYCDYSKIDFPCKPERAAYEKAMAEAKISDPRKCYLIDDSLNNVKVAQSIGWKGIYCLEQQKGNNSIGRGSMAINSPNNSNTNNNSSTTAIPNAAIPNSSNTLAFPTSSLPISINTQSASHQLLASPTSPSVMNGSNMISSSPANSISQAILGLHPNHVVEKVEDLLLTLPHLFNQERILDGVLNK